MKLSVIVPAYNEEKTIREILTRVAAVPLEMEIIVVDDGSSDATREILAGLELPGLRVILHEKNRGKGWAIRTGLGHATGEAVIIQDADLEYDPQDFLKLVAALEEGGAPVVYGSRILNQDNPISTQAFYWGGRMVTLATNLLYGSRLTDEPTCYKLFRRQVLDEIELTCTGFEFCPEVTAKVLKKGLAIKEVPISYHPRQVAEGKKINFWDGIEALWTLLKFRFKD